MTTSEKRAILDQIGQCRQLMEQIDKYKDALDQDRERLKADFLQADSDIMTCRIALTDIQQRIAEQALEIGKMALKKSETTEAAGTDTLIRWMPCGIWHDSGNREMDDQ